MNHWLDNTLERLQLGETLIASGVDGLFHGWRASTDVIGKLCTERRRALAGSGAATTGAGEGEPGRNLARSDVHLAGPLADRCPGSREPLTGRTPPA